MRAERSLEEIKKHRNPILANSEDYRVIRCVYDENFEEQNVVLTLSIKNMKTGEVRNLHFSNVVFNGPIFTSLHDAAGLYLIDTAYLAWDPNQRIEVGDWDGGPPIFWATQVEEIVQK